MSGVFDRMMQRARGQLSAVEPLVQSQRTALAARPGLAREHVELDALGETAARRAPSKEEAMPRLSEKGAATLDELKAAVSPSLVQGRDEPRTPFSGPLQDRRETDDAVHQPTNGPGAVELQQTRIEEADSASRASLPADAVEDRAADRVAPIKPNIVEVQHIESVAPANRDEAERGDRASARSATRTAPRTSPEHVEHSERPVGASGEHTEIHISIGSIELRAQRTEAKAPPFRPRVTLDEFLKRRPGAGS